MKSNAIRDLVAGIHTFNNQQLNAIIADADLGIQSLKVQMKTMSAQYQMKLAVPILRDLNTLKQKAVAEIENRKK